jgi:hypothetical protein
VGIYEPVKIHLLEKFPEQWSSAAHLLAAAAAGTGASIVRVPTEVIKQRMQTGQFATAAGAVKQILAKEGMKGMYAVSRVLLGGCRAVCRRGGATEYCGMMRGSSFDSQDEAWSKRMIRILGLIVCKRLLK